jgi:uncharacterized protein YdhG (YjbR/CyaY superfamily)
MLSGAKHLWLTRGTLREHDLRFFALLRMTKKSARLLPETHMIKRKATSIDEYLKNVKPYQRAALEKLRQAIHAVASEAEECISYGIPALRLNGRSLVFFGAWANHCVFYPGSSATLKKFRNELRDFQVSKGTIRFSTGKPLPAALVRKLVKARMTENNNQTNKNRRKQ